ncbi:actin-related protein-like protein 6 [Aureobasidium pullulans]|uniref:Actin-like protein ARP6 n=1 Tax=Aureobasidium pullulans TaxID=5580 RepID=A0A4S9WYH0_AURPU|nr:actin-related protein-like protein 6 [Aureobasidium pullulans]
MPPTLVVDVGAWSLKAGYASLDSNNSCHVAPNCVAKSREGKTYVGSQLSQCTDYGEMTFRRPVQKGYVVNWPAEVAVLDNELQILQCDTADTNLIITEQANAPLQLTQNLDQMVFEHFDFAAVYRTTAPSLNAYNDTRSLFNDPPLVDPSVSNPADALLVIDSGHSHTTITPLLAGRPINPAIRRLDIGGKHLSNYLAELISLRHFSLIDEPHIVSQIKEDACFLSSDFQSDLEAAKAKHSSIVVDYVLPDYETHHRGFTRPHDPSYRAKMERLGVKQPTDPLATREEVFPLGNERFVVPEILFTPSDIAMPQCGIAETLFQSLSTLPELLWQPFLANILLVGGNTLIPGFVERVEKGVRMLAPEDMVVRVRRAENPITSTWQGGCRMAADQDLMKNVLITRQEYQEHGPNWVTRQFAVRRPTNGKDV